MAVQGIDALKIAENSLIKKRRTRFSISPGAPVVGLALSGGGIRSATFCLGFLQALSRAGLISRIDYVSSVSGGSYAGSFLGALYVPPALRGTGEPSATPEFDATAPLESPRGLEAVRRLRDSGRYLAPAGTSDSVLGGAIVMRNWAAVQFVIGVTALLWFTALRRGDRFDFWPIWMPSAGFSASLVTLLIVAAVTTLAFGSAYWLTRRDLIPGRRALRILLNPFFWSLVAFTAYFSAAHWLPSIGFSDYPWWIPAPNRATFLLSAVLIGSIAAYLLGELLHGKIIHAPIPAETAKEDRNALRKAALANPQFRLAAEDRVRSWLSRWMATALMSVLALAGLLAIDTGGGYLARSVSGFYERVSNSGWSLSWPDVRSLAPPTLLAVLTPLLSFLANVGIKRRSAGAAVGEPGWLERRMPSLLVLAGLGLLALWLIAWSAASHLLVGDPQLLGGESPRQPVLERNVAQWAFLTVLALTSLVLSICYSFINLSSLSTFYAARLRRAYIGASSGDRTRGDIGEDWPQDTIRLDNYYKAIASVGAPLHLINVTIAETMIGTSNIVARDRKGKPMHISPSGIAHEGDRPGTMETHPLDWGEELPLANWVAISGAAVSSAIGSGTSLGTSILATMANVRLGYWWRTQSRPPLFWGNVGDAMQSHILLELRGAFSGIRRQRWYLTDGGHFENTGVYPLLQRELPFIIACDNGADPDYKMSDAVRLISRARVDLGAEIRFLDADQLKDKLGDTSLLLTQRIGAFGELASKAAPDHPGGPIAALAEISYASGGTGLLLFVKPRLTYLEPPELRAYHDRCADFPQQTTADQFFDEEQWEAYRHLGELAGKQLFEVAALPDKWAPLNALR